jgi:prepilin-type N-terminal cleavage/methylation domain-containing protein
MNSRRASHPSISRGFTLPELLVVIALMVAVAGLTLPSALRFYQNQIVDDTARSLQDALRRARQSAASRRNDSAFGVKIQSDRFILFQGSSFAGRTAAEDETTTYPASVSVTGTFDEIVFSRLYATSSASGTISVVGEGFTSAILINNAGKIEIQ